jgi:uncharacterized membrane protein YkoI
MHTVPWAASNLSKKVWFGLLVLREDVAMKHVYVFLGAGLLLTSWSILAAAADPAAKAAPTAVAGEESDKIEISQLPKPVADAVKKKYPKAEIKAAEKGDEDGKTVYEVSITNGTDKMDVTLDPAGKILLVEKEVAEKALPKAVLAAAKAKHPQGIVKLCEELFKDDKLSGYEVTVETPDKKTAEVEFDAAGKEVVEEKPAAGAAAEASDKIEISQLPKPVADAVKKKYPKAEIKAAEKGDEDGKTVYEVSITNGKDNMDVTLDPDGKVLLVEKEVAEKDLPKGVLAAAKAKHPQGTVKLCEELYKNDKLSGYEVTIETPDKKTAEVEFDAAGKPVAE